MDKMRNACAKAKLPPRTWPIDGEMQVNFAMNNELRDRKYPFTRLQGKEVNTLVFPNLSSANAGYQLLQALNGDEIEMIGLSRWG